jgi:Tfp pilus assembly protein PilN
MKAIDFLPDRIRAHRARRHRLIVQGYLLVVCLMAVAMLAYVLQARIDKAQAELDLLQSRSGAMQQQLKLRDMVEAQLADLVIKKRIEEQLGRRVGTLDVLAELQRVMPESMALTNLTMETVEVRMAAEDGASDASPDRTVARGPSGGDRLVKRVRLTLTGMAPTDVDVANFIGQLAASPIFEDVNMGYARNITFRQRLARKFQASCYVTR